MNKITALLLLLISHFAIAQMKPEETEVWEPEPPVITGVVKNSPPSDAVVLLDGTNLDAWVDADTKKPVEWKLENREMIVVPGTGYIETRQSFGDVQLHLEWKTPLDTAGLTGQQRNNSGVFLQSRYEVQILDSYQNRTYSNGQAGAVYKQHIPLVNAMNKPGEWQVYDIIFTAPVFDPSGKKTRSGYITVLHNGVIIQNHVEILGTTEYIGPPKNIAHGKAPIQLQDHSNPIAFRNIWVRELK